MAAKNILRVPKNDAQMGEMIAPMDQMITGTTKKSTTKKPTSFSLDPELLIRFKAGCVLQGRPMSSVLEELMMQFVSASTISQQNVL